MKLGVIMDPISSIKVWKDSTFAMLLAAQRRDWEIFYMEPADLFLLDDTPSARTRSITVRDQKHDWYTFHDESVTRLEELDIVLMRKDPPFDMEYIYATYILDHACEYGTLVVNRPDSLRDANEKLFISHFPQCSPPTLVSKDKEQFRAFLDQYGDIVIKPLDGMGGHSVFRITRSDHNTSVILETLTSHGQRYAMAQKYIREITEGDKRIIMIDGKPVDYALARIPVAGETRGNLAAGGSGEGVELSDRDRWICEQVAPELRERGLYFVGLDVIGDYLTEINVTSPTCIRELDAIYNIDIGGMFMDSLERLRNS